VIAAVVFDLDGVLLDSEGAWNSARRALVWERGGSWRDSATRPMSLAGGDQPETTRLLLSS
jgi:beta-phosphoglucomutase-like phosphatase (HAD superfamily)